MDSHAYEVESGYFCLLNERRGFDSCEKNPGHHKFKPVNTMTLEDLPPSLQTQENMDYVQCVIDRTVRIVVRYVSGNRPDTFMDSSSPYPYSNLKGSYEMSRIGTGVLDDFRLVEGESCPCAVCKKSRNSDIKQFWEFVVTTATHVIFDDSEAENAKVDLFYDSESAQIEHLYITGMFQEPDELERFRSDTCKITCVTHDVELSEKLIQILKVRFSEDLKSTSMGLMVSHPHGMSKRISFGNFLGVKFKFLKKEESNVRFAPTLKETEIKQLKEALIPTTKSSHSVSDDKASKPAVPSVFDLELESFILDASISFPRFSSIGLDTSGENRTIWYQFPFGTKFMTRDRSIIEVPGGMEFNVESLYCYTVYDIPSCPGCSGARVTYDGKNFTHIGAIKFDQNLHNRSNFKKVVEFMLTDCKDDDSISLGSSSLGDEGFSEDIPDVELIFEEPSVPKPFDMLNEKVLEYLEKMEKLYPEMSSHEDSYYHIQSYVEDESLEMSDQCNFASSSDLEQVLNKLVFNKKFAAETANSIPEEILLSQEASYWAIRSLEDRQPCDQNGPYLYNPALRDSWFDQEISLPIPVTCRVGDGVHSQKKKIRIYNVQNIKIDNANIETESNFSYHYHGTNIQSTENILRIGIKLNKGKPQRDYSDGHGFYVSTDFLQASNWACRGRGFPVVIVFKTPKDFFSDMATHIHLKATDLKTLAVLKHFRSGCVEELDTIEKIENPTIDECHSISGPILFNLNGFRSGDELVLRSHQTCIRQQTCANSFYIHLDSIIFSP